MKYGRIIRLFESKGFGFIKGEDGETYFFHASQVKTGPRFSDLKVDQEVEFEIGYDETGRSRAENVCGLTD